MGIITIEMVIAIIGVITSTITGAITIRIITGIITTEANSSTIIKEAIKEIREGDTTRTKIIKIIRITQITRIWIKETKAIAATTKESKATTIMDKVSAIISTTSILGTKVNSKGITMENLTKTMGRRKKDRILGISKAKITRNSTLLGEMADILGK